MITAGLALFVLGFAVGPLLWAPLSEIFGRQVIFIITFGGFTAFNAGCAGAKNMGTLLVLRFFAGAIGSSPLTNAGGVIADIFTAQERGLAMSLFALAPSGGPTLGPMLGGFLGENAGWKWVMGMMAILSGALWIIGLLVPETYAPLLLKKRAAVLSKKTGKVYKTKTEIERGPVTIGAVFSTALIRPWILLFVEPIVLFLTIYLAIIYGTLYLLFGAYPIVFQEYRGWSEGVGGLPFLGILIGMLAAIAFCKVTNKWYHQAAVKAGGIAPPEARLQAAMVGSIAVPFGMFWFAWTNYTSIHWISCVAAGAPFGFGMVLIFLSIINYLVDAYTVFAASALAANTVLRSLFGAAFPLFTIQMYENLGIHWASSIPAFLALACVPMPFILYKYGAAIRARCVFASQSEKIMNSLRAKAAAAAGGGTAAATATAPTESEESTPPNGLIQEKRSSIHSHRSQNQDDNTKLDLERGPSPTTAGEEPIGSALSHAETIQEAAGYDYNPYDDDLTNTPSNATGLQHHHSKEKDSNSATPASPTSADGSHHHLHLHHSKEKTEHHHHDHS